MDNCEPIKSVALELITAIKMVMTDMGIREKQVMLTGGLVLNMYCLKDQKDIRDIDILIYNADKTFMSEQFWTALSYKLTIMGAMLESDDNGDEAHPSGFEAKFCGSFREFWFDIFEDTELTNTNFLLTTINSCFISINNLENILDAKRRLGRPKDSQHFREMADKILQFDSKTIFTIDENSLGF